MQILIPIASLVISIGFLFLIEKKLCSVWLCYVGLFGSVVLLAHFGQDLFGLPGHLEDQIAILVATALPSFFVILAYMVLARLAQWTKLIAAFLFGTVGVVLSEYVLVLLVCGLSENCP